MYVCSLLIACPAYSWLEQTAQTVLQGRVTAEQVKNYWENQAWLKYAACRGREDHTGGGDGDADRDAQKDAEGGEVKPVKSGKPGAKRKVTFSNKTLDQFENSEIYRLMDAVYAAFNSTASSLLITV